MKAELPGVFLAGSSYGGVGIPDCIDQGVVAVQAVLKKFLSGNDFLQKLIIDNSFFFLLANRQESLYTLKVLTDRIVQVVIIYYVWLKVNYRVVYGIVLIF